VQAIPRPGHADFTYHAKYGTHAGSGGGRSSARETIGRVAAGAVAEKWLAQAYGTAIVTFVSSVGPVDLPPHLLFAPDGRPWSRAEVDGNGTLTILRGPQWRRVAPAGASGSGGGGGGDGGGLTQSAVDAADEAAFASAFAHAAGLPWLDAVARSPATGGFWSATSPAYEDGAGRLLTWGGEVVEAAALPAGWSVAAARTDEVVSLRCPHGPTAAAMATYIRYVKSQHDSAGGVLTTVVTGVPVGLGEPVFDKLEAKLAHAMLSLPATKGFDIGDGFAGTRLRGSQHNDPFVAVPAPAAGGGGGAGAATLPLSAGKPLLATATNHAGGTLGGISSGAPLVFRVAIKPVSTIGQAQATATYTGEEAVLEAKGRHDPCVLPRAPPLVEGMAALVLADAALMQRARVGPAGPLPVLPLVAAPTGAPSPAAAIAAPAVGGHTDGATSTPVGAKRGRGAMATGEPAAAEGEGEGEGERDAAAASRRRVE
jgi:chorismate synthase